jgi:hypothetical protein
MLIVNLTLPAGYELAEIPKNALVVLPNNGGRFQYNVSTTSLGVVQLTSRLSFANAVYPAEEYSNLRELYRQMLARQSEKLVIQKKTAN